MGKMLLVPSYEVIIRKNELTKEIKQRIIELKILGAYVQYIDGTSWPVYYIQNLNKQDAQSLMSLAKDREYHDE